MFESLVIMLREGIEIALIVGLMWVYLRKTNRSQLISAVIWGLAGGVIVSLALAWGIQQLDLSKPIIEGTLMFIAVIFVLSMIAWMMHHAKAIGGQIREKIDTLAQEPASRGAWWGIALFTLLMVAREGFEAVVFMSAVWMGDHAGLLNAIGATLGVILAIAFGVAFIRGSVHIDLGRFFKITGIVLLIFVIQLIAHGMHEYGEAGLMNWMPGSSMTYIDEIAHYNVLFILAIIAIPVLMLLIPSQDGRTRNLSWSDRSWRAAGISAGALVVLLLGLHYLGTRAQAAQNRSVMLQPKAGAVEVELGDLKTGVPMVFSVPEDGRMIPLIVLKQGDGDDADDIQAATGATGLPSQFGLVNGELIFYNDKGEAFNPTHYEAQHVQQLTSVPFKLEGRDLYIDVEVLEHAGQ